MNKCECGIAKSLTGDGCRYCQPQTYIDKLSGIIEDMEKEAEAKSALRNGSTGERVAEGKGQQDGGVYEAIEPLINDMMKYNRKPRDRACKLLTALNISPDAVKIFLKNKCVG